MIGTAITLIALAYWLNRCTAASRQAAACKI